MAKFELAWEQAVDAVMRGQSIRKTVRTFPDVQCEALWRRIHGMLIWHSTREGVPPICPADMN
ncbi:hypothetical protein P3T76_001645 [Phytophthora citrophthora]|uniref:Uncharacterized protein n=1 Tax=Phytophthora citrophthora TaxID=4793 RepID=A0AAD9GYX7_9STRA|nr:hypothetical protein P3T76_001645 [Phytophthora citrophthora]